MLIGGGVLGALVLLAGLVITFKTKDGTLVVNVNEPDAEVQALTADFRASFEAGNRKPIGFILSKLRGVWDNDDM